MIAWSDRTTWFSRCVSLETEFFFAVWDGMVRVSGMVNCFFPFCHHMLMSEEPTSFFAEIEAMP